LCDIVGDEREVGTFFYDSVCCVAVVDSVLQDGDVPTK
jgi:hypothetical protein